MGAHAHVLQPGQDPLTRVCAPVLSVLRCRGIVCNAYCCVDSSDVCACPLLCEWVNKRRREGRAFIGFGCGRSASGVPEKGNRGRRDEGGRRARTDTVPRMCMRGRCLCTQLAFLSCRSPRLHYALWWRQQQLTPAMPLMARGLLETCWLLKPQQVDRIDDTNLLCAPESKVAP